MAVSPRIKFLLKNGLKGVIWLAILLGGFFLFEYFVISQNPELWLDRFYSRPNLIYIIYIGSEFFFGIIPPELFMIWAFNKADLLHYILNIGFFAVVSYALGYVNFLIGKFLYHRVSFRYYRRRIFQGNLATIAEVRIIFNYCCGSNSFALVSRLPFGWLSRLPKQAFSFVCFCTNSTFYSLWLHRLSNAPVLIFQKHTFQLFCYKLKYVITRCLKN